MSKPVQVGDVKVSRIQALWLSKRLDCDTDAEATALVNLALGATPESPALTRRQVDGWKGQPEFAQCLGWLTTDKPKLWRGLASVYYAPDAWDALGKLLRSDNLKSVKDGLDVYLKLAGVGERGPDQGPGFDPEDLRRDLAATQQVQVNFQVFRSGRQTSPTQGPSDPIEGSYQEIS